jgi:hypothetical protein
VQRWLSLSNLKDLYMVFTVNTFLQAFSSPEKSLAIVMERSNARIGYLL